MATVSRTNDNTYKNWIKATLALQFWKEGLEEYVEDQAVLHHIQLKTNVGQALPACAAGCKYRDIKKDHRKQRYSMTCPVCNTWLEEILKYHVNFPFPLLSPENTDPQLWPTASWEVAKVYMPYGCQLAKCAKDTDIIATANLLKNCKYFLQKISDQSLVLQVQSLVQQLLDIRNVLFHSANLTVKDQDSKSYITTMLELLQKLIGLSTNNDKQIQEAVKKITKLDNSLLDLSLNREFELKALHLHQTCMKTDLEAAKSRLIFLEKQTGDQSSNISFLEKDLSSQEQIIKTLKETQINFDRFLELNGLNQDLALFAKQLDEHKQGISHLDERTKQHESSISSHEQMIVQLEERVAQLEKEKKSHKDESGNKTGRKQKIDPSETDQKHVIGTEDRVTEADYYDGDSIDNTSDYSDADSNPNEDDTEFDESNIYVPDMHWNASEDNDTDDDQIHSDDNDYDFDPNIENEFEFVNDERDSTDDNNEDNEHDDDQIMSYNDECDYNPNFENEFDDEADYNEESYDYD